MRRRPPQYSILSPRLRGAGPRPAAMLAAATLAHVAPSSGKLRAKTSSSSSSSPSVSEFSHPDSQARSGLITMVPRSSTISGPVREVLDDTAPALCEATADADSEANDDPMLGGCGSGGIVLSNVSQSFSGLVLRWRSPSPSEFRSPKVQPRVSPLERLMPPVPPRRAYWRGRGGGGLGGSRLADGSDYGLTVSTLSRRQHRVGGTGLTSGCGAGARRGTTPSGSHVS